MWLMVIDGGQTNVHNKECLGSYVSWDLKRWGLKKAFERLGISQLINCAYKFLYSYCCGGGARLNQLCHYSRNGLIAKFPGTYESVLGKNYNCPLWLSEERPNLHPWGWRISLPTTTCAMWAFSESSLNKGAFQAIFSFQTSTTVDNQWVNSRRFLLLRTRKYTERW